MVALIYKCKKNWGKFPYFDQRGGGVGGSAFSKSSEIQKNLNYSMCVCVGGVSNSGELGSICLQFTLYKCVNFSYQYPISIIID